MFTDTGEHSIKEIEIGKLRKHPKNVRQNYDGIEELADSIRERGILQNMTVVEDPADEGYYLVVIGNRRLEAARQAGLKTCPCAVVEMSEAEQIATMLLENMQRNDLNIAEETKGVQMCLDLGMTETELSKKTGLSKRTIQSRKKIANMNLDYSGKDINQISIGDLEQLSKIKDEEKRKHCFEAIGTNNFQYRIQIAEQEEKQEEFYNEMRAKLDFAQEVPEAPGYAEYKNRVILSQGDEIPETEEGSEWLYVCKFGSVYLYELRQDDDEDEEPEQDSWKERQRERAEIEKKKREIGQRMFNARKAFMKNPLGHKGKITRLLDWMTYCAIDQPDFDDELYFEIEGIERDEYESQVLEAKEAMDKVSERFREAEIMIYCMLETGDRITCWGWNGEYRPDDKYMETLYLFMSEMGYTLSDEEMQIIGGTHEAYAVEEDDE